ncbi:hypothetical protein B0J14DRAFT_229858 [Halenospora varia]|nr:hypothetical protein B0J14DRAFT_229858 [Halenospora varia]
MVKQKQFLKDIKKKSKHAPQVPSTADEYLAAGVDFEEAGEKWRGGDAAKSARFFVRAIDCYDEGLRKFPTSFDLAYNKARVQYELTQYPKLLKQLPGSLLDLLKTALDSSRYALKVQGDDADALFNTGQVLTSLAEVLNTGAGYDGDVQRSFKLLEEAMEIFGNCLSIQEMQYAEFLAQLAQYNSGEVPESPAPTQPAPRDGPDTSASSSTSEKEEWATVITPVTKEVILETILAQLETATNICSLLAQDPHVVEMVTTYIEPVIEKSRTYIEGTEKQMDLAIAQAKFVSAVTDAKYSSQRSGPGGAEEYVSIVENAWKQLDLDASAEGLSNRAEAFITCSNSIRISPDGQTEAGSNLRWNVLTWAGKDLKAASKFREDENIGKIYNTMGDVELWRFQLAMPPTNLKAAVAHKATLIKNAETYYRGARVLTENGDPEQHNEASVKEILAKALSGAADAWPGSPSAAAMQILEEAVDEGLVRVGQI